jgi:ABC-2 type transport system permease protein
MPDWLVVEEVSSATEARDRVNDLQAGAAVIIPAGFTQALVTPGGKATLEIAHDPTLTVGPAVVEALLEQFVDGVSGARIALDVVSATRAEQGLPALDAASQQALAVEYTTWFTAVQQDINHGADPVLTTRAPGAAPEAANSMRVLLTRIMAGMMIFFAFYGGAFTALSIVTEDELGTLARLFSTPTSRAAVLGGKFLSIVLTLIAQIAVLLTASALLFRIRWGNPAAIGAAGAGLVVAAAGFGLLLMAFIKNTKQGGAILGGVLSLFGLLGGLMTVAVDVPAAMDRITLLTPQGWALRAWDMVLSGQPLATLLTPVAVLVAMGLACLAAGIGLARRRFA